MRLPSAVDVAPCHQLCSWPRLRRAKQRLLSSCWKGRRQEGRWDRTQAAADACS